MILFHHKIATSVRFPVVYRMPYVYYRKVCDFDLNLEATLRFFYILKVHFLSYKTNGGVFDHHFFTTSSH